MAALPTKEDRMERYLLRVNLTDGSTKKEKIPAEVLSKYIGGKGLAAYYCYQEIKPGIDALGPDNKLMFFVGPLTAVFNVYSRHVIAAKSPQTGTFSDSYAGGWFGAELAKAGWLGIILEGKAKHLSCLKIEGERAVLEDARKLAGKTVYEMDELYQDYRVATIGPAGEKLVRFAIVANDATRRQRAGVAGRGGMGAVMGSKNLKAVLVKAGRTADELLPADQRPKVAEFRREFVEYLKKEVVPGMGLGGNLPAMQLTADAKITPVSNFRRGYDDGYKKVSESAFKEITTGKKTCYLCPIACGVTTKAAVGPFAGTELERIEYETVALNGPNCQQYDIGTVVKIGRLCNEYGIDTIAFGAITAFVMEACEKGLIDYKLAWGDGAGQVRLLEAIARREGLGDLLAEGLGPAARKLGLEAIAVHVKGLEIPGYDVRGPVGMALAYATADRGGDHLRAWTVVAEASAPHTLEGKAKLVKDLQDRNAGLWTLIGCDNIPANTTGDPARFVEFSVKGLGILGLPMSAEELLTAGERIYNLTRQFNVREGFSRKEDCLPPRLTETREDTGWRIAPEDFKRLLDEYYNLRGWDGEGRPTKATLQRLGIKA
jgi:aldehyde:ferredoxin oxidoreductase